MELEVTSENLRDPQFCIAFTEGGGFISENTGLVLDVSQPVERPLAVIRLWGTVANTLAQHGLLAAVAHEDLVRVHDVAVGLFHFAERGQPLHILARDILRASIPYTHVRLRVKARWGLPCIFDPMTRRMCRGKCCSGRPFQHGLPRPCGPVGRSRGGVGLAHSRPRCRCRPPTALSHIGVWCGHLFGLCGDHD